MTADQLKQACVALTNHKVHASQAMIMLMAEEKPVSMTEIAQVGGFTTSNATGLIDSLASAGWVDRCQAPEDRRKVMVKISEPGLAILNSINKQIQHV